MVVEDVEDDVENLSRVTPPTLSITVVEFEVNFVKVTLELTVEISALESSIGNSIARVEMGKNKLSNQRTKLSLDKFVTTVKLQTHCLL